MLPEKGKPMDKDNKQGTQPEDEPEPQLGEPSQEVYEGDSDADEQPVVVVVPTHTSKEHTHMVRKPEVQA